jgi:hypothetical protein
MRKKSMEEFCSTMSNIEAFLYLKDCDKIMARDATKFLALIADITRRTNKIKILLTFQKEYATPFTQF